MKKDDLWEKIVIETASNSIKSLVVICLSALGVVLISVYNPLAEMYFAKVPKTILLLLPLSLLLLLLLSVSYIIFLRKKLKINLHRALGAYWDNQLNTYCPSCKNLLTNYAFYETIRNYEPGYKCIHCKETVHLSDGSKCFLSYEEAVNIIKEKQLFVIKNT